ncbi:MAG: DUF6512 family protein [Candidatus Hadarchaeum sp.]
MNKKLFYWTIAGTFFIIFFGSFLHFAFELSGNFRPLALIAAVNESTWEHLKLAFWPAFIFYAIEFKFLRKSVPNFIIAKVVSLWIMPIAIIIIFYSYQWLLGQDILILDIITFIIAIIAGQMVSYNIMNRKKMSQKWNLFAIIFLVIIILVFSLLTFLPPRFFLFRDPISGGYGIID